MTENSPQASETNQDGMRRGFLMKFSAAVVGTIVGLVPAVFGGAFFLTPILKNKKDDGNESDGFVFVGSATSLVPGGPPRAFKVSGVKKDAWTTYSEAAIGAVYVKMDESGNLTSFNASCPHLGCTVNYKADASAFICPCHDSAFTLSGERTNEIPPRPMDALEVQLRDGNEVWVKFQNFRAGTSEKIPV